MTGQAQVDVECSLCPRHGRYRLARLAERYGAAVPLARLLELIASDCTLMKPGEKPRQYEARCGIRYVVPPAGPMPADAPARAGAPRLDPPKQNGKKRLGYDGPQPTIAMMRRQGISAVSVTCHSLWQGYTCHHTTSLPLDRLGASDDRVFLDLCRTLRLVCSRYPADDAGHGGRVSDAWGTRTARPATARCRRGGLRTRPMSPGWSRRRRHRAGRR